MKHTFIVEAIWDEEAGVYYSKSNIIGMAVETETLDEFNEIVDGFAAELISANHPHIVDFTLKIKP
jgi:Domain of unknown function (DUF1902)